MSKKIQPCRVRLLNHLRFIYPDQNEELLADQLIERLGLKEKSCRKIKPYQNNWNQSDIYAITYGDSVIEKGEKPLVTLRKFFKHHFQDIITAIHILPFYPYSSDDGFSVINYKQVNDKLGDWQDIEAIAEDFKLMFDLVINHCSARSEWFERFKKRQLPEKDYFIEIDPLADLHEVIRPRTSPLLKEVDTLDGKKYVWCTFSHDQVDLNFSNPQVLLEMVDIIRFYMDRGATIFRLDAVAFLWKELGTSCLNLPQTHEIVRLLRTLIEYKNPKAIIITETNIPNRENQTYFGNSNEAHVVYNFSLPPLLLHALITGNNYYLNDWMMSMPPVKHGTTYLNFIASHDGIGLRPAEGLLTDEEITQITDTMQQFGGRISWRNLSGGEVRPYEINISLYDALSGTINGRDKYQFDRFICAHIVMLGLKGIPAFYIHSLLATGNDQDKVEATGNNRAINRHEWSCDQLDHMLEDKGSRHTRVLGRFKQIIAIRAKQSAFHPNASQYAMHLGTGIFAFWRQSQKRKQSIFCIHNVTDQNIVIPLHRINLVDTGIWTELLTGRQFEDVWDDLELAPYQCAWLSNI